MPTVALRAEIARLQRSLEAEQRRAETLQVDNQELLYMMDDATRTMRCAGITIDRHIAEAVKMESQIAWLQQRNAYLEACHRHRREGLAGTMMTMQWVRVGKKLSVLERTQAP
jgi:septal ring factor EnvC (AmiA/AmiB activator)